MEYHNPILMLCSILSMIISLILLVLSYIPSTEYDKEVPYPNGFRVVLLIILLGAIDGVI